MTGGLLLVNKSSGPTSYDLIRWIKRKTKHVTPQPKIGHCGTLDPLASGLMIILLGKATKTQSQWMGRDKVYRCSLRLGVSTDSADITGKILETRPAPAVTAAQLDAVRAEMIGPQMQVPPMYSALKVEGTPLYKLARKGQTVERKPRPITIHSLEFLSMNGDDIEFRVHCSSGTYVRTLVEDIASKLGTIATMASLVREKIGEFSLIDAIPDEDLKTMEQEQIFEKLRAVA